MPVTSSNITSSFKIPMSEVANCWIPLEDKVFCLQMATFSMSGFGGKKSTQLLATLQAIQTQTIFHLTFASENKT